MMSISDTKYLPRIARAAALVCAVWAALPANALAQGGPPPAMARLDAVRIERVEQRRALIGDLRAARRSEVASREPGLVAELNFEPGDLIEAGAVIARLDDTLLAIEKARLASDLLAREAEIEEREAELAQAQSDLQRVETLDRAGGANERELTQARTDVRAALARLERTRADAEVARVEQRRIEQRLEDMVIRSPYNGQITSKQTEVGQWVSTGDPVVGLVWLDSVDAYLDVPEPFIAPLTSADATVTIEIAAANLTFEDMPPVVISAGDAVARTFPLRVRLPNPDGALKPGMSIRAQIPTGQTIEAMTISKDAIMRNDAGAFVYFDAGGVAGVAPVEPMFATGGRVVVRSPALREGMRIVVEGNERMFPGQPIQEVGAGSGAPGAPAPSPQANGDAAERTTPGAQPPSPSQSPSSSSAR
ncbi:MAG: efflux RND transporter periplasmic adaptor subunit [Phycisphaerales bacterium]